MDWQTHNQMTSRFVLKRNFLSRKLAQHEHAKHDRRDPFKHERMAALYRAELRRLEAR